MSEVGRGQQHMVGHRVLHQAGLVLEGGGQQRIAGDEGHHELGRGVDPLPVLLLRQGVDVGLHLAAVAGQVGAAHGLVIGLVGVQEGLHGHLGVDGHVLAPREVDHHVGTQPAAVGVRGDLLVEVAVLEHAGHLHHPAELQLTPTTPGLRGAQGGDQVAGLLLQLVVRGRQVLHLLGQRRVGPLPLDLEALHPFFVLAQLLADGLEQLLDGLLPLGQLPVGRLAGLVELGVGQLQELLVVLLEGQRSRAGRTRRSAARGSRPGRPPAPRPTGARARARRSGGPPRPAARSAVCCWPSTCARRPCSSAVSAWFGSRASASRASAVLAAVT